MLQNKVIVCWNELHNVQTASNIGKCRCLMTSWPLSEEDQMETLSSNNKESLLTMPKSWYHNVWNLSHTQLLVSCARDDKINLSEAGEVLAHLHTAFTLHRPLKTYCMQVKSHCFYWNNCENWSKLRRFHLLIVDLVMKSNFSRFKNGMILSYCRMKFTRKLMDAFQMMIWGHLV